MQRLEINKIAAQYQELARTFDSPERYDSEGNRQVTDYKTKLNIYDKNKEQFFKKSGIQQGSQEFIELQNATADNGYLEGWEYKAFYNRVLADVKHQVEQMNFAGEEFIDNATGALADYTGLDFLKLNTVKNAKELAIAKLMRAAGLEYKIKT